MSDEDETLRLDAAAKEERSIVVMAGTETQLVPLPRCGVVTIGRSPKCDVVIPHPSVSREHLRLVVAGDIFVEDLGAVNQTRVAGAAIRPGERVPLSPGILVDVGAVGVMVRVGRAQDRAQAPVSPALQLERFAKSSLTVLIQGETGSGKEVMAEEIHRLSPRASAPLLRLNCAAVSDTLMESELFGHERGAFTGAVAAKPGLLETANGGTVFLDEIGDMSLFLQAKLLRVLEERKVWRVGALKARPIDVRFIAATNRPLNALAAEGRFRQDLLFRLNAVTLSVPPLRERTHEIESFATKFIAEECRTNGRDVLSLSGEALQALLHHDWPGNVRELRNVIGRAVAQSTGATIGEEHLGLPRPASSGGKAPAAVDGNLHAAVDALEEERIKRALEACNFNRTKTAEALGIARNTLASRMVRFGIQVPDRD